MFWNEHNHTVIKDYEIDLERLKKISHPGIQELIRHYQLLNLRLKNEENRTVKPINKNQV